jgi:glycogen synthase
MIPICKELGIPVLVTPVGGLPEQVVMNKTGIILESTSASHLAMSILDALARDWEIPKSQWRNIEPYLIQTAWNQK